MRTISELFDNAEVNYPTLTLSGTARAFSSPAPIA